MRVLLVDDEPLALDRLKVLFADIADAEVVGVASDGDEALDAVEQLKPDLVILDVQMPGRSGLRAAADLRTEPRPELVFVTAHEHYAPDAFEVDAADYLIKPVRFDRLRQAVERARRRRGMRDLATRVAELEAETSRREAPNRPAGQRFETEFWVQARDGVRRVLVADIEWIEAAKDYVILHTATRSHILRSTMAALEGALDPAQLLRVHRSAFVQPQAVTEIRREGRNSLLVLRDGATVPVGPNYVDALERALRGVGRKD